MSTGDTVALDSDGRAEAVNRTMTMTVGRRRRRMRGQAMVEFVILLPMFLTMAFGVLDFGNYVQARLGVESALRVGIRYAAKHPTSWSGAASPSLLTIEGMLMNESGSATSQFSNDDTHIKITYWDMTSPSAPVQCGFYTASGGGYGNSGLTHAESQASCVKAGNEIRITVTSAYTPLFALAGIFPARVTYSITFTELEEV